MQLLYAHFYKKEAYLSGQTIMVRYSFLDASVPQILFDNEDQPKTVCIKIMSILSIILKF